MLVQCPPFAKPGMEIKVLQRMCHMSLVPVDGKTSPEV